MQHIPVDSLKGAAAGPGNAPIDLSSEVTLGDILCLSFLDFGLKLLYCFLQTVTIPLYCDLPVDGLLIGNLTTDFDFFF